MNKKAQKTSPVGKVYFSHIENYNVVQQKKAEVFTVKAYILVEKKEKKVVIWITTPDKSEKKKSLHGQLQTFA